MVPRISLRLAALSLGLAAAPVLASTADVPRTPSGRPDLSGTYDIANLTPFERDPKYGDRLVMTDEEARAIEAQIAGFMALANRQSDPDREAPPVGGDGSAGASGKVGGYNAFWIDAGERTLPIDGQYRTSILSDPRDGRLPALTPEGKARRDAINPYVAENTGDAWWLETGDDPFDGPESLTTVDRCLYVGVATVPARSVPYNNLKTILQTDDQVVILVEWMHWARVIRLDSEHGPPDVLSMSGDSIGRWEGDTLVVETSNFLRETAFVRGSTTRSLRLVERFTRLDADTLQYEFTVEDPSVWTRPWTVQFEMANNNETLYEYACHEGNYGLRGIMAGHRKEEEEKASVAAAPQR
jgi:hypothetical protein